MSETKQALFWFVHSRRDGLETCLAVAAFTARSARVQARKRLGPDSEILGVSPVAYAHAWVIELSR